MPPKKTEKPKRRNKRKSRTEVESSSSSEDEKPQAKQSKLESEAGESDADDSDLAGAQINEEPTIPSEKRVKRDPEVVFEEMYLRQTAKEFANDLDKLRSAGDFQQGKSVAMLVRALKEGTKCFTKEERVRVAEATREGN